MKLKFDISHEAQDKAEKNIDINSDERLLEDIRVICRMIDDAYARFQMQQDDDLVEASIYEIEALKARYRYLLRLAKARNVTCSTCIMSAYEKI